MSRTRIVQFLGLFSIGLGLTELLAPGRLGRLIGLDDRRTLLRGYGLREITAGMGLLSGAPSGPWLWARALGDVLDAATLVSASTRGSDRRNAALATLAAVSPLVLLDFAMAISARGRRD